MHFTTWASSPLVRDRLWVERISFMFLICIYHGRKSSFSGEFRPHSESRASFCLSLIKTGLGWRGNGSRFATFDALDAVHGAGTATPAIAGAASGPDAGTQSSRGTG